MGRERWLITADTSGMLPFLFSPHFPCTEARPGAEKGAPDAAQDPQILNLGPESSFPCLRPFPGPTSPWAWGASHPGM